MKTRRPQEGEVIEVDWKAVFAAKQPNWKDATVQDCLSAQFTVKIHVAGEPLGYYFYNDHGDTWRTKNA